MQKLNLDNVELKYIMHFNPNPDILDCLYEMVNYLDYVGKDSFTEMEYSTKTKYKIRDTKQEEIQELIDKGYIQQLGRAKKYTVVNHPWF